MRGKGLALGALGALLVFAAPASGASKNVKLLDNLPEAKDATAINFLEYGKGKRERDVMLVTGRFGLKSYSLDDPRHPELLDEVTAEELRLPGDPPVRPVGAPGAPQSTFWQNEDMDVDRKRKLALLSRDPRAYAGSTTREPGEADPNGATNIAGVYVIDAKDPERPEAAELRAAADRPHHHLHQRLRVAVDRRPGRDDHPAGPAAELDVRPPDHRHRSAEPEGSEGLPDGPGRPVPPRRRDRVLA